MKRHSAWLTDVQLDALRRIGDDPADQLVAQLGRQVWAVNAAMRAARHNSAIAPESLPTAARELIAHVSMMPSWWDAGRVVRAQTWAQQHLFSITVALFCAALPAAYAAEKGARVLRTTGRMTGDLDRRIGETARFVLDVLTPGAFEPNGSALCAVIKVRLMHAAVRGMLAPEQAAGDAERPINQEDLLGMLFGFSVLVTRSLTRLGVPVEARDAEDFYHLWRGVGVLLGVRAALLPADVHEATCAMERIAARQVHASEHGQALTAALVARMEQHFDVPGLRAAPRALIRYLLGERYAEILGVASGRMTALEQRTLRELSQHRQPGLGSYAARLIGQRLLEALATVKLAGKPVDFAMPLELSSAPRPGER